MSGDIYEQKLLCGVLSLTLGLSVLTGCSSSGAGMKMLK